MNGSSVKKNSPSLFPKEESPKKKRSTRPPPTTEKESVEFQTLIESMSKRDERRRSKSKTIGAAIFTRAREEARSMMKEDDWTGCSARHLVALYDLMHTKCYGVECIELGPTERYNAVMMAANLVKKWFDDSYEKAVKFMHWAWTREIRTEKWRRENDRFDSRRIGFRLMFGGSMVSDYRVSLARQNDRT